MPRLLLLRHAKSSWGDRDLSDRERPLSPRGRDAAALMAAEIAQRDRLPDRILCSPARRARETLAALMPKLPDEGRVAIIDDLYEPPSGNYLATIMTHGGEAERLLLIGHNPCMQTTALTLLGGGEQAVIIAGSFPTAALAVIEFDQPWHRLSPASGHLVEFLRPRDLGMGEDD